MAYEISQLVVTLALALALTELFELAGARLVFGLHARRELAVVALVQVVTNPTVELICLWQGWRPQLPLSSMPWLVMLAAELGAILIEALLYRIAEVGEHPWVVSITLNTLSFGLGIILALVR